MRKSYLVLLLLGFLVTSCHKDLDIVQDSQLSANSMWTEESDARSAMAGTHLLMRAAFNKGLVYWGEYRTGLWGPGNHGGLSQTERDQTYQNTLANTHTYADWEALYKTINQTNLIIKYTPGLTFSNENQKNEILANAYFIRATCYYWIVRIWGDTPLVLEGYESADQDLRPTRTPASKIYEQVEADITSALSLMPATVTARKTASLGAINMLKADYSLWMYKVRDAGNSYLIKAQDAVAAVMTNGNYSLEANYKNVFESENGREVIYAWNYELDEYTGGYPADYQFNSATVTPQYHYNPIVVGTGQQWTFYTNKYIDVLTEVPTDTRLLTNYQTFYDPGMRQNFSWTNKYKGTWLNNTLILNSDIILYRLADAYLFDAEIKYHQSNLPAATQSLNNLVKRAYGTPNYYATPGSPAEFKAILVKERMKELPAEGKLWWDFIRLDVVFDMNPYLEGKQGQQNILLWPLSDNSINDNPNLGGQTPGWN
jgi:hypothetical protein